MMTTIIILLIMLPVMLVMGIWLGFGIAREITVTNVVNYVAQHPSEYGITMLDSVFPDEKQAYDPTWDHFNAGKHD